MALAQNRSVYAVERYTHIFLKGCGIPVCLNGRETYDYQNYRLCCSGPIKTLWVGVGWCFIFTRLKKWANNGLYLTPSRERHTAQQTLALSGVGMLSEVLMNWNPLAALQPSAWTIWPLPSKLHLRCIPTKEWVTCWPWLTQIDRRVNISWSGALH